MNVQEWWKQVVSKGKELERFNAECQSEMSAAHHAAFRLKYVSFSPLLA